MWPLFLAALVSAGLPQKMSSFEESSAKTVTYTAFNQLPTQYHTYASLLESVKKLGPACAAAGVDLSFSAQKDGDVSLDVVHLKSNVDAPGDRFKVGAVFGEHSRELISPEMSLAAMRAICGGESPACPDCTEDHSSAQQSLMEQGARVRSHPMDWAMVLNGNPLTRANLETKGDFCLRLDPDDVDPNRNYDAHFDTEGSHGPTPFSQPETRALKTVLSELKPNAFFSIHSGELGLYGPHAWTTETPESSFDEFKVLDEVKPLCPECPIGPAGKLQGRPLTGSSLDYARDVINADYSYAYELFVDKSVSPNEPDGCFRYFNPSTPDSYHDVTTRFANMMLQTAELSRDHLYGAKGDQNAREEEASINESNLRASFLNTKIL